MSGPVCLTRYFISSDRRWHSQSLCAVATPSGVRSTQDTVNTPESSGFKMVMEKVGNGPLDQCTVDTVRRGATVPQAS